MSIASNEGVTLYTSMWFGRLLFVTESSDSDVFISFSLQFYAKTVFDPNSLLRQKEKNSIRLQSDRRTGVSTTPPWK